MASLRPRFAVLKPAPSASEGRSPRAGARGRWASRILRDEHAVVEHRRRQLDALRGDQTLFMRSDELDAAWEFVTPILDAWQAGKAKELPKYQAGTWGPVEADRLAEGLAQGWRRRSAPGDGRTLRGGARPQRQARLEIASS